MTLRTVAFIFALLLWTAIATLIGEATDTAVGRGLSVVGGLTIGFLWQRGRMV